MKPTGFMEETVIYPPCKKCGASHGMGIEDMATGKIESIDLCYRCLWEGFPIKMKNLKEVINLSEKEEILKRFLESAEKEILENA
jgi:hypothetical protein